MNGVIHRGDTDGGHRFTNVSVPDRRAFGQYQYMEYIQKSDVDFCFYLNRTILL